MTEAVLGEGQRVPDELSGCFVLMWQKRGLRTRRVKLEPQLGYVCQCEGADPIVCVNKPTH